MLFLLLYYGFMYAGDVSKVFDDAKAIEDLERNISSIRKEEQETFKIGPKTFYGSTITQFKNNECIQHEIISLHMNIGDLKSISEKLITHIERNYTLRLSSNLLKSYSIHMIREGIFLLNLILVDLRKRFIGLKILPDIPVSYEEQQAYIYPTCDIFQLKEVKTGEVNRYKANEIFIILKKICKLAEEVKKLCNQTTEDLENHYIPSMKTNAYSPACIENMITTLNTVKAKYHLKTKLGPKAFFFVSEDSKYLKDSCDSPEENFNILEQLEENGTYFFNLSFRKYHENPRKIESEYELAEKKEYTKRANIDELFFDKLKQPRRMNIDEEYKKVVEPKPLTFSIDLIKIEKET